MVRDRGILGCYLWRRQWHPTPVLLPGKSHGWRSLVGCSPWGAKSRTRLNDFTLTFHFPALEKEMATHSSVLAWRIPGTGEPGGLPSMGSHRIGHDWSNLAAAGFYLKYSWNNYQHIHCTNKWKKKSRYFWESFNLLLFYLIFCFLEMIFYILWFWSVYLFMAILGLDCCVWAFL